MGSLGEGTEYDAVVVGAGFAGYNMLRRLREIGLRAKIFERGGGPGGVWYWNQYPGARCDSDLPAYQFFDKELWEGFTFRERFPGYQELQRYFNYVEDRWDLRKDIEYHKNVDSARWLTERKRWLIAASDGTNTACKWLFLCVGSASKTYVPNIRGVFDFKGEVYHTARWPQGGVSLEGKRVAVIGTGASGIQVIQEAGRVCKHLTVYQRTPNLCLPMHQRGIDAADEKKRKEKGLYDQSFQECEKTYSGVPYDNNGRNTFDDSEDEREALWTNLTSQGGFKFWVAGYKDLSTSQEANDAAYNFWRRMVLRRIKDPEKAKLLAPAVPPHPYGAKRPSLEQNYYEVMSQDNVDIVDAIRFEIEEITATGIKTAAGQVDVDLIVLATGFDALTGGLLDIELRGADGRTLKDCWKEGIKTSMGIAAPRFPNMFFLFGPQAPSTFANGPSCIQFQGRWLAKLVETLHGKGVESFAPTESSAEEWGTQIRENWWNGANIPGKKVQPLAWAGGLPLYMKLLDETLADNYKGWLVDQG